MSKAKSVIYIAIGLALLFVQRCIPTVEELSKIFFVTLGIVGSILLLPYLIVRYGSVLVRLGTLPEVLTDGDVVPIGCGN